MLSEKEKLELKSLIVNTVEPMLVELGTVMLEEINKINLSHAEMLGSIFSGHVGDVVDGIVGAHRSDRERIEVQARKRSQRISKNLGFRAGDREATE